MMLTGTHWRTVDAKGRIIIPGPWKPALDGVSLMMTRTVVDSLVVVRLADWHDAISSVDAAQRGAMLADSWPVVINGAAIRYRRICVPFQARNATGLRRSTDAVLIGRGRGFEVWSARAWARERDTLLGALREGHGRLSHPLIPWLGFPAPEMAGTDWYDPHMFPECGDAAGIIAAKNAMPGLTAAEAAAGGPRG